MSFLADGSIHHRDRNLILSPKGSGDPRWNDVILLLQGAPNLSSPTNILDKSRLQQSPTSRNNTVYSGAVPSLWAGSFPIYYPNSIDNTLQWPALSGYNNGTSWSLEFWIYINANPPATTYFMGPDNVRYWTLETNQVISTTQWGGANLSGGAPLPLQAWTYVCLSFRNTPNTRTSLYIGGTRVATSTGTPSTYLSGSIPLGVPNCAGVSFLDELRDVGMESFRFTSGTTPRYDPDLATIPVPAGPFPLG